MPPHPDSPRKPLRVLTNFARFPEQWALSNGWSGTSKIVHAFQDFVDSLAECDVVLVNCELSLTYRLCLYFAILPWKRKPLLVADLVLSYPESRSARFKTAFKRAILRRVDHFINYFKYSEGYGRFYGITADKSSFVHFKSNLRYRQETVANPDGEYVLCLGRSRRDYDTFFHAVEKLPYPAAIPRPNFAQLREHGSRFTRQMTELPPGLQLLDDDGTQQAMMRMIAGAKVVALPIIPNTFQLAGVSVCLDAMLLGKCVILTEGAGVIDALTDEALFAHVSDADALAAQIRAAWEDDNLRLSTARKGYEHAVSVGGEPELFERILGAVTNWMGSTARR